MRCGGVRRPARTGFRPGGWFSCHGGTIGVARGTKINDCLNSRAIARSRRKPKVERATNASGDVKERRFQRRASRPTDGTESRRDGTRHRPDHQSERSRGCSTFRKSRKVRPENHHERVKSRERAALSAPRKPPHRWNRVPQGRRPADHEGEQAQG
jgi:hypothetical protein